jgi:hypothetical protein
MPTISRKPEIFMATWERKRILIWGKTRPELSRSHKETVCTGGIFEDNKQFVRLYPIPLRYLDEEQVFRKYQWIEADVRKAIRDPRPESYNIRCDNVTIGETIPAANGDWSQRAKWILRPDHIFQSVEALQVARLETGTTIGMVKPLTVDDYLIERYPEQERDGFWTKCQSILSQQEFKFDPDDERAIRPLPPPEYRFQVKFRCDDPACARGHVFSIFDWEVDALYNRLRQKGETCDQACEKVLAKLRSEVCADQKDTYFFMGNMASHPHKFTIVGLWYPKKVLVHQATLFDNF